MSRPTPTAEDIERAHRIVWDKVMSRIDGISANTLERDLAAEFASVRASAALAARTAMREEAARLCDGGATDAKQSIKECGSSAWDTTVRLTCESLARLIRALPDLASDSPPESQKDKTT